MSEVAELQCSNPDCRVSQTGKCVEGLAIDKCPHAAQTTAQVTSLGTAIASNGETTYMPLAKAEWLSIQEASAVTRSTATEVIAIIGPTAAGKTSLIASLCDLFQRGQIEDIRFARTRTMFAFEQACHHARAASLRDTPQTEHTSLASGLGFYQLCTRNGGNGMRSLLFADRSGEDYRAVADDPRVAAEFPEVRRANVITVLVNGDLLLDIGARHNVRHQILMILQGLLNGDAFSRGQRLCVVLTKLDKVHAAAGEDRERAEQGFDNLVRQIETVFDNEFAEIRSFKIAASPTSAILPHGHGVPELLRYWSLEAGPAICSGCALPKPARAMGRFGMAGLEDLP